MNDFKDIMKIPDFKRKIWLVKKDRNEKNDWWVLDDKGMTKERFLRLCDKHKFFAWSYVAWGCK